MNAALVIGFVLNSLATATLISDSRLTAIFYFLLIPLTFSAIGIGLILIGKKRLGANITFYSGLFFVPLGMVQSYGGRILIDQLNKEQFYQIKDEV